MDIQQLLVNIFEHYYRQTYGWEGYKINKEANQSLINNFFKLLDKNGYPNHSIGSNFLNAYLSFQFEYWIDKDIKRKPTINWFIGKKAIERYFSVEDWKTKAFFVSKNTQHIQSYAQEQDKGDYESALRKKFHNKEKGLIFCVENTSLYTTNATCLTCKFKGDCKKLLKENYPLLYKKRIK